MHRVALVAFLAACSSAASRPTPVGAPSKPKLVVLIVIDQLPMWAFERDRHLFTGGLARLLRDGALATLELPYANTFTAPGHATIGTGVTPREHGIVGNDWYRREDHRVHSAEFDAEAPTFAVGPPDGGEHAEGGVSGAMLRAEGIADHLRAQPVHGRSVAVAFKPRAAALMTGRHPDLAIWYEPGAGGMTTSSAYVADVPVWLRALVKVQPISRFLVQTWTPLDAALLARETKIPDDGPGEASEHNLGRAFPHRLALADSPAKALGQTPFADQAVLETAEAAIDGEDLGSGPNAGPAGNGSSGAPDLLAISLGAHDFAGHAWGPDSWEELDLTLRLDLALGKFFANLDARFGAGGYAVVLTSDHGATPLPERGGVAGARRVKPLEVESAVAAVVGLEKVDRLISQNLYLEPGVDLDAAAAAAGKVPNIARAIRTDRACASQEPLDQLICEAVVPDRGGELYVVPVRGSIVSDYPTGTHHDGPYAENRFVPLLVMAPGVTPGAHAIGTLLQVAPTVERLLGLPHRIAASPALFVR